MALLRTVTVGFRDAQGKIHEAEAQIPADWVSGERDAREEVVGNARLRTRFSVDPASMLFARISEPWDPNPHIGFS